AAQQAARGLLRDPQLGRRRGRGRAPRSQLVRICARLPDAGGNWNRIEFRDLGVNGMESCDGAASARTTAGPARARPRPPLLDFRFAFLLGPVRCSSDIAHVRFWPKADILVAPHMSAFGSKADMLVALRDVCF